MSTTFYHIDFREILCSTQAPLACRQLWRDRYAGASARAKVRTASAVCRHCGGCLQWLSQYTPEERQARRQAAPRGDGQETT